MVNEPKSRVLIAQGRRAKVYLEGNYAIKVYDPSYPLYAIFDEIKMSQYLCRITDLPIPLMFPGDKSNEIKMDYLEGETLETKMRRKDEDSFDDFIPTQLKINSYTNLDLPSLHDRYERILTKSDKIATNVKEKLLTLLNSIERKTNLCHMDYHVFNVMIVKDKYYIIDWVNAGIGNPIFDVARTYLLIDYHSNKDSQVYLGKYCKLAKMKKEEVLRVLPVLAALRLEETSAEAEVIYLNRIINEILK